MWYILRSGIDRVENLHSAVKPTGEFNESQGSKKEGPDF